MTGKSVELIGEGLSFRSVQRYETAEEMRQLKGWKRGVSRGAVG